MMMNTVEPPIKDPLRRDTIKDPLRRDTIKDPLRRDTIKTTSLQRTCFKVPKVHFLYCSYIWINRWRADNLSTKNEMANPNMSLCWVVPLVYWRLHTLPITHYPLPINHYPLSITHYPLPITHYPLTITH